jgi:acetylornithine/LysW-gamma-L-lysine aminotransferase
METKEILEMEKRFEIPVYPKRDIALARGQGCRVWDTEGKEYLDCAAGVAVAVLGHNHPALVKAVSEQAGTLITCYELFQNEKRARLLAKLAQIGEPLGVSRSFLSNSGAEAIEAALKFARAHTKRKNFVACMMGFHGKSMGALSLTFKPAYKEPFLPLVEQVKYARYGDAESMRQAVDENTAAVFMECIQGEGGIRVPPEGYLTAVREICDQKGALLIVDEIQTGMGRTGKMFACEHEGIKPDIVCIAKGIAGGLPMGATIVREEVAASLKPLQHTSTFGGNPLCCAASLAVFETIEKDRLLENARDVGEYFISKLRELAGRKKDIREVRGRGLIIGVEMKKPAKEYLLALAAKGVIALSAGDTVLRFVPPLIFTREDADRVMAALEEIVQ